jgi:hypothetical protein
VQIDAVVIYEWRKQMLLLHEYCKFGHFTCWDCLQLCYENESAKAHTMENESGKKRMEEEWKRIEDIKDKEERKTVNIYEKC